MTLTAPRRMYVLVLLAGSAAACSGATDTPAPASSEQAPLAVSTDTVAMTPVPATFESGGALVARQSAIVSSRVTAAILRVAVQPGDQVRRGQLLVQLDSDDLAGHVAGASAALAGAQAALRAAQSQRVAAESAVVLARATHDRIARLHKDRSATPQELDQAVAGLQQAEAHLAATAAHVDAATEAVNGAAAGARVAGISQGWATLVAPFDCLVVSRHVDPGTTIGPGQPLVTIEGTSGLQMEVRLDATRAASVARGQGADVRIESGGPSDWVRAGVSEIARVDPQAHAFTVTLDVPTVTGWRSGFFGRARFSGPPAPQLTVAGSALVRRGQLIVVYVVDDEGRARLRVVSTGREHEGRVEVLAGLTAGERVVIDPPAALADGRQVRS